MGKGRTASDPECPWTGSSGQRLWLVICKPNVIPAFLRVAFCPQQILPEHMHVNIWGVTNKTTLAPALTESRTQKDPSSEPSMRWGRTGRGQREEPTELS